MRCCRALFALLLLTIGLAYGAPDQVAIPALSSRVTDLTGTLNAEQRANLEQRLAAFEQQKGSQLTVLLVPTTKPEAIEQYSLRVAEQWKLGRKKVDDGALLVIAKEDRAMRIEVGYGLEGALNDATAKRIISEVIAPHFKAGDFYGGVSAGVDRMISVIQGEALPEPKRVQSNNSASDSGQFLPIAFIIALVVGGMLRSMLGRFPGALVTGGVLGAIGWVFAGGLFITVIAALIGFMMTLLRGGMGRGGMFSSGMFSSGGFGGGGFSSGGGGFSGGGGSFGGGGASGNW